MTKERLTLEVAAVELFRVQIPMKNSFEHAGGARTSTDNLLCLVRLTNGVVGVGEGVPRKRVTGESIEDCFKDVENFCRNNSRALQAANARGLIDQLSERFDRSFHTPTTYRHNAARAALETAYLDAIARCAHQPLVNLLTHNASPRPQTDARFSLVFGREFLANAAMLKTLARQFEVRFIKMKVGFGMEEDRRNMGLVRSIFGADCAIRVDANQQWVLSEALEFAEIARGYGIAVIEDPLRCESLPEHLRDLSRFRRETGFEVVLDESVRNASEAEIFLAAQAGDVINIRVSKCGGLLGSLKILQATERFGVDTQVGCQVGESAVLSAAGRLMAHMIGEPRFIEGSNEVFKFESDHSLTRQDLAYGPDMQCRWMAGEGLGVDVLFDRLERFSVQKLRLELPP